MTSMTADKVSIGVQTGPQIGVQKGPLLLDEKGRDGAKPLATRAPTAP